MQKEILEIVADFDVWKGNSYTLAALVAAFVKNKAVEILNKEYPEASQKLGADL